MIPSFDPTASTTSSEPTGEPTAQPTFQYVTEVVVQGNYDEIVGDNKELFLEQCSDEYKPVVCLNVGPGSIIITLGGDDENEVEAVKKSMEDEGVNLNNFAFGNDESDDSKSGSSVGVVLAVLGSILGVLFITFIAWHAWKSSQNTNAIKPNKMFDEEEREKVQHSEYSSLESSKREAATSTPFTSKGFVASEFTVRTDEKTEQLVKMDEKTEQMDGNTKRTAEKTEQMDGNTKRTAEKTERTDEKKIIEDPELRLTHVASNVGAANVAASAAANVAAKLFAAVHTVTTTVTDMDGFSEHDGFYENDASEHDGFSEPLSEEVEMQKRLPAENGWKKNRKILE